MPKHNSLLLELFTGNVVRDLWGDIALFVRGSLVEQRVSSWEEKISEACKAATDRGLPAKDRVTYTGKYLDVLDSKFSTLLQFLSLSAVLIGIITRPQTLEGANIITELVWFWLGWILAVLCCLRGVFRVAWLDAAEGEYKEEEEFHRLVTSLVRRTAWLRAAALLTTAIVLYGVVEVIRRAGDEQQALLSIPQMPFY